MIVDYAGTMRTYLQDIYLTPKCQFFIGKTSGLFNLPLIFRRPVAYANWIPLGIAPTWSGRGIFIPKQLWLRNEGRFMTFREILDTNVRDIDDASRYEQLGIDVFENTPQEITALAIEMDDRINGTWRSNPEDEESQSQFLSLFMPKAKSRERLSRIGADFYAKTRIFWLSKTQDITNASVKND